jgi:arabinofuranosyltransferase
MPLARKQSIALFLLAGATLAALYVGWRTFWFLTDDAYIAFRYVSNGLAGYGYVWNPPPFRPVEGYTSFLWVVLLDVVWRLAGVEPPRAANLLSLLFAALTLLLVAQMVLRMTLRESLHRYRLLFLAVILAGILTNRTFLAWTSSGLETAMFNFFLTMWVYGAVMLPPYSPRWLSGLAAATALSYLTRPDGLLIAVVTVGLIALAFYDRWRSGALAWRQAALLLPLLAIPGHLVWRYATYGEWLPNTYYAKSITGQLWTESGLRYFLSFLIEYSLWIWLLVLGMLLLGTAARTGRGCLSTVSPAGVAMVGLLLAHLGYYTLVIGGDHFEFRVYSHLIPLLFVSFLWMLNSLRLDVRVAVLLLLLLVVLSWPIPWTHWSITRDLTTREETAFLKAAVAPAWQARFPPTPEPLVRYLRFYDDLQFWLIDRAVGMRHQEHRVFHEYLVDVLPSRVEGLALPAGDYPVLPGRSVGVVSWVLPTVNIIDTFGLNDYVIARNPELNPSGLMAHQRIPPPGYVECFLPNVTLAGPNGVTVSPREVPLTAQVIKDCERSYGALVR